MWYNLQYCLATYGISHFIHSTASLLTKARTWYRTTWYSCRRYWKTTPTSTTTPGYILLYRGIAIRSCIHKFQIYFFLLLKDPKTSTYIIVFNHFVTSDVWTNNNYPIVHSRFYQYNVLFWVVWVRDIVEVQVVCWKFGNRRMKNKLEIEEDTQTKEI